MNDEKKTHVLEKALQVAGFDYEIVEAIPHIPEPLLLIKNYAPSNGATVSIAFTLLQYDSGRMESKCWMTCATVKTINDDGPRPHEGYQKFVHDGIKYFPYSVQLHEYRCNEIASISRLCRNLYGHVVFEETA